jgi:hypothetical protein
VAKRFPVLFHTQNSRIRGTAAWKGYFDHGTPLLAKHCAADWRQYGNPAACKVSFIGMDERDDAARAAWIFGVGDTAVHRYAIRWKMLMWNHARFCQHLAKGVCGIRLEPICPSTSPDQCDKHFCIAG